MFTIFKAIQRRIPDGVKFEMSFCSTPSKTSRLMPARDSHYKQNTTAIAIFA